MLVLLLGPRGQATCLLGGGGQSWTKFASGFTPESIRHLLEGSGTLWGARIKPQTVVSKARALSNGLFLRTLIV